MIKEMLCKHENKLQHTDRKYVYRCPDCKQEFQIESYEDLKTRVIAIDFNELLGYDND